MQDTNILEFLTGIENTNVTENLSSNTKTVFIPDSAIELFKSGNKKCVQTIFQIESVEVKEVLSNKSESSFEKTLPNQYKGMNVLILTVTLRQISSSKNEHRIISKDFWCPEPVWFKGKEKVRIGVSDLKLTLGQVDWVASLYNEVTKNELKDEGRKLDFTIKFTDEKGQPTQEITDYIATYGSPAFTPENKETLQFKFVWEVYLRKIAALFNSLSDKEKLNYIYAKVIAYNENYILPDEKYNYKINARPPIFERAFQDASGAFFGCTIELDPEQTLILAEKPKNNAMGANPLLPKAGNVPATGALKKPDW